MDEELKKYLSKFTCRGCGNHCSLLSPACGRSKIYIKEAEEKYNNIRKSDNFGTFNFLK